PARAAPGPRARERRGPAIVCVGCAAARAQGPTGRAPGSRRPARPPSPAPGRTTGPIVLGAAPAGAPRRAPTGTGPPPMHAGRAPAHPRRHRPGGRPGERVRRRVVPPAGWRAHLWAQRRVHQQGWGSWRFPSLVIASLLVVAGWGHANR